MLKQINLKLGRLAEWLPTKGNVLFTLLMIGVLVWAQGTGAFPAPAVRTADTPPTSTGTVAYQGRLADTIGDPLTGTYPMVFRLYDSPAPDAYPLWEENWTGPNSVKVSKGLFNVMLGSMTPITQSIVTQNDTLWLGITVGTDDEMMPRVQLGGVPYAVQANTVLNNSITTEKIVDGAVMQAKLGSDVTMIPPDGSVTTPKLADNAVTSAKIGADAVGNSEVADGAIHNHNIALDFYEAILAADTEITQDDQEIISLNVSSSVDACYLVFSTFTAYRNLEGRTLARIYDESGTEISRIWNFHNNTGLGSTQTASAINVWCGGAGNHTLRMLVRDIGSADGWARGESTSIVAIPFAQVP